MTTPSPEPSAKSPDSDKPQERDEEDNVASPHEAASKQSSAEPSSPSGSDDADKSPALLDTPPAPAQPQQVATHSAGDWQAIWSPAHNTYYFYNSMTQETTWANPLQSTGEPSTSAAPESSTSLTEASTSGSTSSIYDLQAAAAAQGIDPSLAHLDPSLAAGPSSNPAFSYTAKFNARTGAFAKPDGRDPTHLSEYERAKRMSEFYFDVNAWEKDVEARKDQEDAEGKKRKRPSKKDLVSRDHHSQDCGQYSPTT